MALKLDTAPLIYPLTALEVQEHLRMSDDEAEELATTIDRLISDATAFVEDFTWRALITQEWEYYLDDWPPERFIRIPKAPLQSIDGVDYTLDGEITAETFTDYETDIVSEPGRIILERDESWPTDILTAAHGIKIAFTCGYGDNPEDVPIRIRQAMLLHITQQYDNVNLRSSIDSILMNYRVVRW